MQVILLKNQENVGEKHDVVEVKNGYGRNYLIPNKIALIANKTNLAKLAQIKEKEEEQRQKVLEVYRGIVDKLGSTVIKIGAKAGATGKIFGSVTNIQLAQAIKEQLNEDVDRKIIELPEEEIKHIGSYTAKVNFDKEVVADLNFEVVED